MGTINLLYKNEITITDKISVVIPTVGDILENEEEYYNLVGLLTAAPIDLMVALNEANVDFTSINDFELFVILLPALQSLDTHNVLKDIDLSKFRLQTRGDSGVIVVRDPETGAVIDRVVHARIAEAIRKLHGMTRDKRKPIDKETQEYMLKRAKEKASRKKKSQFSNLEQLIVALVNTEQYKYNYEETLGLTIYQFNESVRQIQKKIVYEHTMNGVYAGTVDPKKLSQQDLSWLSNN